MAIQPGTQTDRRIGRTLIDEARLRARIAELATAIRVDCPQPTVLHLVTVLKGGFMFLADLARVLPGPVTCDFMAVASYDGDASTGRVRMLKDLDHDIRDRDVVLIEDVVDSGRTLAHLHQKLTLRKPRTLRTVCLLDKPSQRQVPVRIDYVGFTIGDEFVVGYGLDFNEQFRDLPYIAALEPPTS